MAYEEVLKAVFPLLEGADLASCMLVCKQWRDIAQDDYFWKCVCAKRWPSICKRPSPPTVTYYKREIIFSEVVPGPVLQTGIVVPPPGICDMLRFHLEGPEYKMTLLVEPRFTVPLMATVSVSVLVGRKDSKKVACIINKSMFDYIDRTAYRALAFDYLDFSPSIPSFLASGRGFHCFSWKMETKVMGIENKYLLKHAVKLALAWTLKSHYLSMLLNESEAQSNGTRGLACQKTGQPSPVVAGCAGMAGSFEPRGTARGASRGAIMPSPSCQPGSSKRCFAFCTTNVINAALSNSQVTYRLPDWERTPFWLYGLTGKGSNL
ncbi:F-box protein [Vitis vinifera]|uniref:F-box protein n=1 Tax=Vitis vinifera TaxID=29760 RepID=A0A438JCT1_VITVI|nr:F-box protein [Vitis vinifera]